MLYFYSTNKFSLRSGEYRLPLYGWLPDRLRYRFRRKLQGQWVVESSHLDFNQFTYWGLRRLFRQIGFSLVADQVDFMEVTDLIEPKVYKRAVMEAYRLFPQLKIPVRLLAPGNCFLCVK